jgi:hypothetical protein
VTSPGAAPSGTAARLGVTPGALVQSLGEDSDGLECDPALLAEVAALAGEAMVPEDSDEIVDVVILWFREDDGDLVDTLMDARRQLDDHGVLWLFTPKPGRDGHVEPSDVQEAVPTAGLQMTSTVSAAPAWTGSRLVAPKGPGKKR